MAQHAAQANPARVAKLDGSNRRARSASVGIGSSLPDDREWNRAARVAGACDQVVAAGVDGGAQRFGDDLKVCDLRLDLGELGLGACVQSGFGTPAVPMPARIEQIRYLIEGEPEPLRRLDDAKHGDGFSRVHPMAAQAPLRLS